MYKSRGFPGGAVVKNPPANAGDLGLIPGPAKYPGGGHGSPLLCLAGKTPWTEMPGGLQPMGSQRAGGD